jgi:regulator of replication initiation timing
MNAPITMDLPEMIERRDAALEEVRKTADDFAKAVKQSFLTKEVRTNYEAARTGYLKAEVRIAEHTVSKIFRAAHERHAESVRGALEENERLRAELERLRAEIKSGPVPVTVKRTRAAQVKKDEQPKQEEPEVTSDFIAAFSDPQFSDFTQIGANRGVKPVAISEVDFNEAAQCDFADWQGSHDSNEPFIARLIDPLTFVPDLHKRGKEVAVHLAIARDAKGRRWALAAAENVSNDALLTHLNLLAS